MLRYNFRLGCKIRERFFPGRRGGRGTKLFCSKRPVEGVAGLQTGQYRFANRSQLDAKVVRIFGP